MHGGRAALNAGRSAEDGVSPLRAWLSVAALSVAYLFSIMDRHILILVIEPIKTDLAISDTQVSLITGLAFAIIYTVAGIPLGRLADLWMRKNVIMIGIAIWSLLTIASGAARSFTQLFVARMGVGFGEAGLTSPAYSMIADLFPPNRLAFAMSVFVLGGVVGTALALFLGGAVIAYVDAVGAVTVPLLGAVSSWRLVLLLAGLASLATLIPIWFLREPARRATGDGAREEDIRLAGVAHYLRRHWIFYLPFIAGSCLRYLVDYGTAAWLPSYFIRVHGWEAGAAGMTIGGIMLAPFVAGALIGGRLADWLYERGRREAPLQIMIVTGPIVLAANLIALYASSMPAMLGALGLSFLAYAIYAVLHPTVIQMATPNRMRSLVSSIVLFAMNLLGLGLGSTAVALLTDHVFGYPTAVRHSIAVVGVAAYMGSTLAYLAALRPFRLQRAAVAGEVGDAAPAKSSGRGVPG